MKKYYAGYMDTRILENHSSAKAFYISYDYNGFGKYRPVWIPKSICKFDEPNEFGNLKVYIPQWWFRNNPALDYKRFSDIIWCGNGEQLIVNM